MDGHQSSDCRASSGQGIRRQCHTIARLDLPAWAAEAGAERSDYILEIDAELRFVDSGVEREIDLGEKADPVCLRLLGKTVSRAVAFEDGRLHVDFVDGDVLTVEPSAYEPWHLNGTDGSLVVSVAGGGLAVWAPSGKGT